MYVKAPFKKRFHDRMATCCKVVAMDEDFAIYEIASDVKIDSADLGMTVREFNAFCRNIDVEGGRKVRRGSVLLLKPRRTRTVFIKLSEDEYALLREYADDRKLTISNALRSILAPILMRGADAV